MIKVYFETNWGDGTTSYAEHVATLDSEPASEAFWDAMLLVAQAKGFDKVTESVEDGPDEVAEENKYLDEVDQYTTSEGEVLS